MANTHQTQGPRTQSYDRQLTLIGMAARQGLFHWFIAKGEQDMASTRAEEVAELLWELKRASKIAKYSVIAKRAGFSAGVNGKAMETCLKTVRRDWPHLQWWRAVSDSVQVEKDSEQAKKLAEAGVELKAGKDNTVTLSAPDDVLMEWPEPSAAEQPAEVAAAKK